MQSRVKAQSLSQLPNAERRLAERDSVLARLILSESARWPSSSEEDPIWGLVRIVMAQQVSTHVACRLAGRARSVHAAWMASRSLDALTPASFKSIGLSQRRAQCCADVLRLSESILKKIEAGHSWEDSLKGIKGIGPWTLAVFKIMVLRQPDILPLGDVGLERAITKAYGKPRNVVHLGESWRPFRSVACWYLWRTLGNEQLG